MLNLGFFLRPVQNDHMSHTVTSLFEVHQKHFASYWSGETVNFIFIYGESPLLSKKAKFNVLRYNHIISIFWAFHKNST